MEIEDRPSGSIELDLDETLTRTADPAAPSSTIDLTSDIELVVDVESQPRIDVASEAWTVDAERASLEAAARRADDRRKVPSLPPERLAVALPKPSDLGKVSSEAAANRPRSVPPPLPSVKPSAPPPLPSGEKSPSVSPSKRPPPLPGASATPPAIADVRTKLGSDAAVERGATLVELLEARVTTLRGSEDRIGMARALVELAIVHETLVDDTKVGAIAERALETDPDAIAAHGILRRRLPLRDAASRTAILAHLEREIAASSDAAIAADRVAERARVLEADGHHDDAREAYEIALAKVANHPAALRGLEAALVRRALERDDDPDGWEALATHLGKMSDAYAAEPSLAAWLHVERARILELKLGRIDAAKSAYERALRLDPAIGPVRDAFALHAAMHHDASLLTNLLAEEASIESNAARGARLELDAACIARTLLDDDARAILLLELAAARAPTTPSVDRRVLDDLVRSYERVGRWSDAVRARRLRLRFFERPRVLVHELRRIAAIEERLGRLEAAARDIGRALELDPSDATLERELDRLLDAAGDDEARTAFWRTRANDATDPEERAKKLVMAAQLAERRGRLDEARAHLRAAWAAAPGKAEIVDPLARLLTKPAAPVDPDTRALVDLYTEAARTTTDEGRRIAYLEKVALLCEEITGDRARAADVYEEILRLAPGLRGAVLGLERTAARVGDARALALALLEEAKIAAETSDALALRVRAAEALAESDPTRALAVVTDVLAADPAFTAGRELETRLHADAGRWEQVAASLRARIDVAKSTDEKIARWLELAQIQDVRLQSPRDAVLSLREARRLDPSHPVPPEEITRLLELSGDVRELRGAVEQLAEGATTPEERARHLSRAAELDELVLDDDIGAASLYERALAETPEDVFVAERHLRVLARRAVATAGGKGTRVSGTEAWGELLARIDACADIGGPRATATRFLAASLRVATSAEADGAAVLAGAIDHLEATLSADPRHAGALRSLERAAIRTSSDETLHEALALQGERFANDGARAGALWALAALEAWRWPAGESAVTYERILARTPKDVAALESAVRLTLAGARAGQSAARHSAVTSLRTLADLTKDPGARVATNLRLAFLLEAQGAGATSATQEKGHRALREALERLHDALVMDPFSVTAATMLADLANRLDDVRSAALAATSLAELAIDPKIRTTYFVDAAHLVWTGPESVFGPRHVRAERAGNLLESALKSDPDAVIAAERLARVRADRGQDQRLVDVFRAALDRATSKEAIVFLGSDIARVCRNDPATTGIALEAMRKVRAAAPEHVPSLLTLSELFMAERAWPEAVEVLEAVVARASDVASRTTALFALANVHEKILDRPKDAEDALRRALALDGSNPKALRLLVHRLSLRQEEAPSDEGKLEIAGLLERLAAVEDDRSARVDVFIELAELRLAMNDRPAAERALVEATATAPEHPRAFARLTRLFRTSGAGGEVEPVSYAHALEKLVARGRELGTNDARWHAALGHVLASDLDRLRDGVIHLEHALAIDPNLHASRFELATAHLGLHAHDLAAETLLAMMNPTAEPLFSVADPAAALELLERAFGGERKQEEAIVVSELRAIAGSVDDGRRAWLKARRLTPIEDRREPLERKALAFGTVPPEGRSALIDVASAIAGLEAKLFRADLGELGISSRDRIGRRSGHPTRALFDRLARVLDLSDVELVVTPNVPRVRVIAEGEPWVLLPSTFVDLPEPSQLSSLARALARIALGVPWLEELPPPHIEALLVGAARVAFAGYAEGHEGLASPKLVTHYQTLVAKEASRKHKQALEKLAPILDKPEAKPSPIEIFVHSLARAELRTAYVLTGDLLATIDELRHLDTELSRATETPGRRSLGAVLDHPFAGDVARFALTSDATGLRRRAGSTWSG